MKRRARIVVPAPDFEGEFELPVKAPLPHAEDWPQGTYAPVLPATSSVLLVTSPRR